ncbi:hypothetical protein NPX13_g9235 [Xylaria arbuscula]|uniref:Uncharacterized protein n=1 Tax=Xylaria arbuscula TaxID=114810 RepID=A0A9W8N745_9PEZI|nr:hypothetical protein NPX13_g9235 [Xylaria arbuscula]
MKGLWRWPDNVGILAVTMLAQVASAYLEDDGEWEVHWVDKNPNPFRHAKRKSVCQLDGWLLCPSSVGGGCCPPNFECGTASCYATTSGPTSCHGKTGYYNCPLTLGGNCCPVGLICNDSDGCENPPGVTTTQSCPASWVGCPASLGGGCCRSGQLCGQGVCYDGTPQTFQVSETKTTTDSKGHTTTTVVTSMSVITDGPPSSSPVVVGVPQFVPSTVAKVDALQTNESGGGGTGGLSSGALGGIITGVIFLFIAVVVAATFIVLRLRRAEKAADKAAESRRESEISQSRSHKPGFGQPTISEIDSTADTDPLRRTPNMLWSPRSRSTSAGSPHSPFNVLYSDTSSKLFGRFTPSITSDDNGPPRRSQRGSVDSQGTYRHTRQGSGVSELEGSPGKAELEASDGAQAGAQEHSNSITQPSRARTSSDPSSRNRARGDSNTRALDTVTEFAELHGYYGNTNTVAGQTNAILSRQTSTTCSSPTLPAEERIDR